MAMCNYLSASKAHYVVGHAIALRIQCVEQYHTTAAPDELAYLEGLIRGLDGVIGEYEGLFDEEQAIDVSLDMDTLAATQMLCLPISAPRMLFLHEGLETPHILERYALMDYVEGYHNSDALVSVMRDRMAVR